MGGNHTRPYNTRDKYELAKGVYAGQSPGRAKCILAPRSYISSLACAEGPTERPHVVGKASWPERVRKE